MSKIHNNKLLAEKYINGDNEAFDRLILDNMGLVKSTVKHFMGRGTDYEDLVQIGSIGLIKAAKAFNPELNYEFSTYAFSMITGELRRYFRDNGLIKISRNIKSNCIKMLRIKEEYLSEYGVEPSISYLSEKCGIDVEEAVLCLGALAPVESTNASSEESRCIEELVGFDDIENFTEKLALYQAVKTLTKEEQIIIGMRYNKCMTQSQTAKRLGYTQVKISRAEKKIIEKLKNILM